MWNICILACRTPRSHQVIPETDRHAGFQDNTTPTSNDWATNEGMSVTFIPPWYTTHAPLCHCGSSLHHHASNVSSAHINSYAPWAPPTTPRPPSCPKNDTGRRDVAPPPPTLCSHMTELSADNCSDRAKTSRRVWANSIVWMHTHAPATLILGGSIWVQTVFI